MAGSPIPVLQSIDKVGARTGVFRNSAHFSPDAEGHTGTAGDRAADLGTAASNPGPVYVADGAFFNTAAANDEISVAFWTKRYDVSDSSAFWADSPSSNNGQRGYQAHVPWSNNNIYFDTAGCCAGSQRISADIATLPTYTGDQSWWKDDWHLFVFSKKADIKQIWIDGALFLEGTGAAPLPQDFTGLWIGSANGGGAVHHGLIDDFMVFSKQLIEADITDLFTGTSPTALDPATGLLAWWDFNDAPTAGQFTSLLPVPDTTSAAPNLIQVVHLDGTTPWTAANVSLKVDGVAVTTTFDKDPATGAATVSYVPSPFFVIQSKHTATLSYPIGAQQQTLEWSFVVGGYSKDVVASRLGAFRAGASFTGAGGGHTGLPADRAADLGRAGSNPGPVYVADGTFFNAAAANDEISVAFWTKRYDITDSSAFWADSPSSSAGQRGYQAHVPWGNNNIYFDSAGCCAGGAQRISGPVNVIPEYTDTWWFDSWHLFVFSKKADNKQVWIDGVLFLEGTGAAPLPQDFTDLWIGSLGGGGGVHHGLIDDFSVFSTQLAVDDIALLFSGTAPTALPPSTGLLALWNFDDFPPGGLFKTILPVPNSTDAAPNLVQVVHLQGANVWDLNNVSLKLDGAVVAADKTSVDGVVTVTYVPNPLLAAGSKHTATLTYPDGAASKTLTWDFTVALYTKDVLHGYLGVMQGAAVFTPDSGGHSGNAGDRAIDLGANQAGQSVHIVDASFMNEAAANDEMAIGGWQKLYSIHDSAFFWGVSPSSNGSTRGWGTHAPWSNNNLYFDTAGCCGGDQRTSAPITGFPLYTGDVSWWNDWHYILFQKKLEVKEIWIDGQLLISGSNVKPLPIDFTEAFIGFDPPDNARMQGLVDDVAVFKTALDQATIMDLSSGALPTALPASVGLIAYWNFNDAPAGAVHIDSVARNGASLTISWSGGTGPYLLERKSSLSDAIWVKLLTTSTPSATVAIQGKTGFFRVSDKATVTVVPLKATLNGAAEKPNAVNTTGTGTASLSLEGNNLWYYVSYQNLQAGATAAHIHGPADANNASGVLQGLGTPTGTSGSLTGVLALTDQQRGYVQAGNTYVNIHSPMHPGGEIRGQITP